MAIAVSIVTFHRHFFSEVPRGSIGQGHHSRCTRNLKRSSYISSHKERRRCCAHPAGIPRESPSNYIFSAGGRVKAWVKLVTLGHLSSVLFVLTPRRTVGLHLFIFFSRGSSPEELRTISTNSSISTMSSISTNNTSPKELTSR